jgi:hypothetical protein
MRIYHAGRNVSPKLFAYGLSGAQGVQIRLSLRKTLRFAADLNFSISSEFKIFFDVILNKPNKYLGRLLRDRLCKI